MSNREIEKNEALARIKGLENELANGWQRDRIKALEDRIEQLEAALRARSDSECVEPAAWQWRYVGELDWKTRSGGLKLTPDDMKNERPIEQRPLYAGIAQTKLCPNCGTPITDALHGAGFCGSAQTGVSQEALDWAAGEAAAIEEYKKANPEQRTRPAREVITPRTGSVEP